MHALGDPTSASKHPSQPLRSVLSEGLGSLRNRPFLLRVVDGLRARAHDRDADGGLRPLLGGLLRLHKELRAFRHVHKFAIQIALRLFPMITLRRSRLGTQRPRPLGALGTELCLQGRELAFAGGLEAVARHEVGGLEGSQALGEDLAQQLRAHKRGRRTPLRGGCTSGAGAEIQLETRKGRLRGLRSARLASIHAVELLPEVQRQQPSLATTPARIQEQVIIVVLDIGVIDDVMLLLILHQLLHGLK
mmetsp:Transcript_36497/g.104995  ORF Transcript_36497/g.104995 Transcript_36497/m.104995 type:complete len:248 (+) Transcript_36497:83-826(+)